MPLEILNRFREGARMYTDPAFNWSEAAVIFYKSTGYNEDYGPSFYCHWTPHDSYYNNSFANERALCIGAVMTYFQYPPQYAGDYDLYHMSEDVRSYIGTVKTAIAQSGDDDRFLEDMGYAFTEGIYDSEMVKFGIRNSNPSLFQIMHEDNQRPYFEGDSLVVPNNNIRLYHYAIINGYRNRNQLFEYKLYVPQRSVVDHQLRMINIAEDSSRFLTPLSYYIIWGYGYFQGWYLSTSDCPIGQEGYENNSLGIVSDTYKAIMDIRPSNYE